MRPRPVWFDQTGSFWKRRRLMTKQAKLKLCKTHSAISILIQFAEQFFKFLDKKATTLQAWRVTLLCPHSKYPTRALGLSKIKLSSCFMKAVQLV